MLLNESTRTTPTTYPSANSNTRQSTPTPTCQTNMMATTTSTTAADQSSLLERLPDDIIRFILSSSQGNLLPTTLVEFACTCKAAAALTLPILYSSILVPSLPALAQIHSVLAFKPELAQNVRSLTVSEYFADPGQFTVISDALGELCKGNPMSAICSVDEVEERCGTKLLNMLPMAWFIRMARTCPKLVSIDLSRLPDFEPAAACLTFGLLDLAHILRDRGGRFTSTKYTPFSAVEILLFARSEMAKPELSFVTGIDWGRKQIDVTNITQSITLNELSLVPFCDLTSTDLSKQQQWTLGRAAVHANATFLIRIPIPTIVWQSLGIRSGGGKTLDHRFDFTSATQLERPANVSIEANDLARCSSLFDAGHIDAVNLCYQIRWALPRPEQTYYSPRSNNQEYNSHVQRAESSIARFAQGPRWDALTHFVVGNAFFLTPLNFCALTEGVADSMLNLTHLELLNLYTPMDCVLMHLDQFIRRSRCGGRPLQSLRVSAFCFSSNDQVMSTAAFQAQTSSPGSDVWILNKMERSPLDSTQRTRGHLHSLQLEISGPGADELPHTTAPTVAIHPGLLHGLENVTLKSVKLVVMPPHLARPTSASFLPISAFSDDPDIFKRTPLTLEHVSLTNLKKLEVTTHSLATLTPPSPSPSTSRPPFAAKPAGYRVPDALPYAPALEHLHIVSADATQALVAKHVLPTLFLYPNLVCAQFESTALQAADVQALVRSVLSPPRVLSPCPRLRNLIVGNVLVKARAGRANVRGELLSMPHLTHLADAVGNVGDSIKFTPTSVERKGIAVYQGPDVPACVKCTKCGLLVPEPPEEMSDEDRLHHVMGGLMSRLAGPQDVRHAFHALNSEQDTGPGATCPACGPRRVVSVTGIVNRVNWPSAAHGCR